MEHWILLAAFICEAVPIVPSVNLGRPLLPAFDPGDGHCVMQFARYM